MAGIRMHVKDAIHFVTNRCEQEQLLLLPNEAVNALILVWLARALTFVCGGIEIYAIVFLSNHYHILLRDTGGKLAEFMGYFQGNLAKAVNKELGRRGKFWAREYDDVLLKDDADFLDRYAYVLCNAVKAGLVDKAVDWLGVSSLSMALTGEVQTIEVINWTKVHNATRRKKKVDLSQFKEQHTVSLAIPPMWQGLGQETRAEKIRELVKAEEHEFRAMRESKPALGMKNVLKQSPFDRPKSPSFRPRIKVFSKNRERRQELLKSYREHVSAYRETWNGFIKAARKGKRPAVEWPDWSYPPSSATPMGFDKAA